MNYNRQFVNLVNQLTPINESLYCKRTGERIRSFMRSNKGLIIYDLSAPHEYFGFDGDEFAVKKFREIHNAVAYFDGAALVHASPLIQVVSGRTRISFPESQPRGIRGIQVDPIDPDWCYRVRMTKKFYERLRDLMGLAGASHMRLSTGDERGIYFEAWKVSDGDTSGSNGSVNRLNEFLAYTEGQVEPVFGAEAPHVDPQFNYVFDTTAFNSLPWLDNPPGYEIGYDMFIDKDGVVGFSLVQIRKADATDAHVPLDIELTIFGIACNDEEEA